jgi:hypothetical protein
MSQETLIGTGFDDQWSDDIRLHYRHFDDDKNPIYWEYDEEPELEIPSRINPAGDPPTIESTDGHFTLVYNVLPSPDQDLRTYEGDSAVDLAMADCIAVNNRLIYAESGEGGRSRTQLYGLEENMRTDP